MRVVVFTMIIKILCLMFCVSDAWPQWNNMREREDFIAGKIPFFELPCMRVGGTCSKVNNCPPNTKVGLWGLCPEQQQYGMECCISTKILADCTAANGVCYPKSIKCYPRFRVKNASGCGYRQTCCLRA